ncbi:hypothetical protein AJ79_06731 [Helicocarpus griseus UAMH5409]|uniref:Acid phosphatase n=1 Tax=Helicocarpus griseus UAMH5409 TaxID=1447875 RepID=A0A2B7X9Q0_9EURO|nr:hypothetical protein AJ79_06731 [Helicocarpus griseus UAMH5409]
MHYKLLQPPAMLALAASLGAFIPTVSAETVLGAYVFARHGDRTSKATPPTELTSLGYSQVFNTGTYYHDRYISPSSDSQIFGISPDIVKASQLSASAPEDEVLQKSALAFLQALYPPAGDVAKTTLRDGTEVETPMNGYQLVALEQTPTGGNSENVAWLQSASKCPRAKVSSNEYFSSPEYLKLLESSAKLYKSIAPMVSGAFSEDEINYQNAYAIWDYLNVAKIHNTTDSLPADQLPSDEAFTTLQELANTLEYNLAYNASSPIRAASGSMLAGEILTGLQEVISSAGNKTKLNVQFGAYANFLSFFGLTGLAQAQPDFAKVPDYASNMAFELVTNATVSPTSFPEPADISVRFLFRSGSVVPGSKETEPVAYPLFSQSEELLMPWSDFESKMKEIAIATEQQFCEACSEKPKSCSGGFRGGDGATTTSSTTENKSNGISTVVAGVIGALVTLGVILGLQLVFFFAGGWRLVKKVDAKAIKEIEQA